MSIENNLKLKYWDSVSTYMVDNPRWPSISFSFDEYYSISCNISKDGKMKISTYSPSGHGEGSWEDDGRSVEDWINLIREAEEVAFYFWGKQ